MLIPFSVIGIVAGFALIEVTVRLRVGTAPWLRYLSGTGAVVVLGVSALCLVVSVAFFLGIFDPAPNGTD